MFVNLFVKVSQVCAASKKRIKIYCKNNKKKLNISVYSLTGSFHIWLTLTVIKGDNKHMLHFFPSFKTCFSVYLTSMQKNLDRTVIFTLDNWDAFWPDPWVRKMFTLFFRVNGFFMLFGDGFRVSGYYKSLFLLTHIRFHL